MALSLYDYRQLAKIRPDVKISPIKFKVPRMPED
jgi:hypothetical protein